MIFNQVKSSILNKMSDIKEIMAKEVDEITDFLSFIEDYGHIFHGNKQELQPHFDKIIEGIEEVRNLVDGYWDY